GGDELVAWLRYVRAVQEACPSDQTEQFALLERCARRFRSCVALKNDPRYLRVWIEYADHLTNSGDLFKYLYKNAIGVELALFWVAWAWVAETNGDYLLADKLYGKATALGATPVEAVRRRHKEFIRRMSRLWLDQQDRDAGGGGGGGGGDAAAVAAGLGAAREQRR
ncbi:unnamed protein product, partial [Phaeothamnion confervicola]